MQDFAKGDRHGPYWPAELYRDEAKEVFAAALGGRRQGSKLNLLSKKVVAATARASAPAIFTESAGGDYFNLGGVFVTAGARCVYVERQRGFADAPSLEPLLAAARSEMVELQREAAIAKAQLEADKAAEAAELAAVARAVEMERVSA